MPDNPASLALLRQHLRLGTSTPHADEGRAIQITGGTLSEVSGFWPVFTRAGSDDRMVLLNCACISAAICGNLPGNQVSQ